MGGAGQAVVLLEPQVVQIDLPTVAGAQDGQHLRVFAVVRRLLHQRHKVIRELEPRVVVQRELPVDALRRLGPPLHRQDPRREQQEVELREARAQRRRRRLHVLHEHDVAVHELVQRRVRRDGRLRELRDDRLRGGAVAAADDDVRVALRVAGERLGRGLAYAGRPADEERDG